MQTRNSAQLDRERGGERGCWRRAEERAGASRGRRPRRPLHPRRRSGAPGPGAESEGPGLARTLAGGAGRWTAARLEQEGARRARAPSPPRAVAREAAVPYTCGRGSTRTSSETGVQTPGDPPPNVGHIYLTPPSHTHTLKHAHAPGAPQTRRRRKRGNFGGMRVDPQVRLENRGPGALPARVPPVRGECDPGSRAGADFCAATTPAPYPTTRLFSGSPRDPR